MLIYVLWCTSDSPTCKATIACAINYCRQQINSGIWKSSSPKTSCGKNKHADKSCKTANRVLGFIARNFGYKNRELILPLYKSLVRQHLEHAVQFWSPHLRRDINEIEKIQREATKMILEIRNHSYHQWIQDLKLISFVQRRLRGQLIEVFKYLI